MAATKLQTTDVTSGREIIEQLLDVFDTIGYTVDATPLDTSDLPQKIGQEARKDEPYWLLRRSGRGRPDTLTIGPSYQRRLVHQFELQGFWAFQNLITRTYEWEERLDQVMDALEAHRRLFCLVLDSDPPELVTSEVRDVASAGQQGGRNANFRYHYGLIRFGVKTIDRMTLDGEA